MNLFHFTCLWHLPSILRDGLTHGQMPDLASSPASPTPNLTSNPNRKPHEVWCHHDPEVQGGVFDKLRFRLSVLIPDPAKVIPQRDLWRMQGIARQYRRAYDPHGQSKFWFIHFGTIPAYCITKVEEWDGSEYVQADLAKVMAEHGLYEVVQVSGFRLVKLKSENLPTNTEYRVRDQLCLT